MTEAWGRKKSDNFREKMFGREVYSVRKVMWQFINDKLVERTFQRSKF